MVVVTVKLSLDTALALQNQKQASSDLKELLQVVNELRIKLTPMHPGAQDALLAPWYTIMLTDNVTATHVLVRLQNCKGVEAAYIKPPTELP